MESLLNSIITALEGFNMTIGGGVRLSFAGETFDVSIAREEADYVIHVGSHAPLLLNKLIKYRIAALLPDGIASVSGHDARRLTPGDYASFASSCLVRKSAYGALSGPRLEAQANLRLATSLMLIQAEGFLLCHEIAHVLRGDLGGASPDNLTAKTELAGMWEALSRRDAERLLDVFHSPTSLGEALADRDGLMFASALGVHLLTKVGLNPFWDVPPIGIEAVFLMFAASGMDDVVRTHPPAGLRFGVMDSRLSPAMRRYAARHCLEPWFMRETVVSPDERDDFLFFREFSIAALADELRLAERLGVQTPIPIGKRPPIGELAVWSAPDVGDLYTLLRRQGTPLGWTYPG